MALALGSSLAMADTQATAGINTVAVAGCNSSLTPMYSCVTSWTNVGNPMTISTSNSTSLFVNTSLVTGLYTSTQVKGNSTGDTSSATASAIVSVRVVLDGTIYAAPDTGGVGITFDSRVQTLTANLGYIFTSQCAATPTTCTLTPQQVTLVLDTASAHSFNFILLNVGAGTHTVQIQAATAATSTQSTGGVAISNAAYGLGSTLVNVVRLGNSFSF